MFDMILLLASLIPKSQLSSPKPKSKVPKSRPKGLGLTLKSHGPPLRGALKRASV